MSKHAAPSLTNDAKEAERDALKAGPHVVVNQPRHTAHPRPMDPARLQDRESRMMPIFRTHPVPRRDTVREWVTITAAYTITGIIIAAVCVGPAVIVSWITGGFS